MTNTKTKVVIYEMELGWGRRVEEVLYFDSITDAESYVQKFNARNNKTVVPDWYMYAEVIK